MAFIGTENLKKLLKKTKVIEPYNESSIKNGAYELSLGNQVFQTDSNPRSVITLEKGQKIYIDPGQFALLLTEETLKIPRETIAFISIKATIKFKGLINVSGFHVDPGFEGKLLFSVYNAGPSRIVLSRGTKYFPIWFADLNESQDYVGVHNNQDTIPDEPIAALSQGEITSPNILSKRIDDNQKETEKRLGLIEKDQKANNYLVVTGVGVFFAIVLKLTFDFYAFNKGIDKGTELQKKQATADSIINHRLTEKKRLLIEIDSLENLKKSLK